MTRIRCCGPSDRNSWIPPGSARENRGSRRWGLDTTNTRNGICGGVFTLQTPFGTQMFRIDRERVLWVTAHLRRNAYQSFTCLKSSSASKKCRLACTWSRWPLQHKHCNQARRRDNLPRRRDKNAKLWPLVPSNQAVMDACPQAVTWVCRSS